jgi:hypothetical protein
MHVMCMCMFMTLVPLPIHCRMKALCLPSWFHISNNEVKCIDNGTILDLIILTYHDRISTHTHTHTVFVPANFTTLAAPCLSHLHLVHSILAPDYEVHSHTHTHASTCVSILRPLPCPGSRYAQLANIL